MKVLRSTVVAAVAFFAVACGDKVTVAGPPSSDTTPTVTSVSVAPATATLNVGQTVTFSAAVNTTNGAATTVTWTSSDPTKVSMSGATATANASTPGVAICATSTVDTGKQGCASVAVTAAPTVIPATVQIQSVTTGAAGQPSIPATGAVGTIDVRLSVSPGNQTVQRVVLVVGGVRIDSQVYTPAQSAALRYAADQAAEAQTSPTPIVFNVNTAAYDPTTGVPTFTNGAKTISAQLYIVGSSNAATATAQTSITFANVDGFAITTSGGNTAVDGAGYRWNGNGTLTVNALPVMYSGSTIGTVAGALSANPAAGTTCGGAVGALTPATTKTGNVYVLTGTFAGLASPAGCTTVFPNVVTITATSGTGDNLTLAGSATTPAGVIGTQTGLRWDNVAPPTAGLIAALAVNGRTGNWINDAVTLNAVTGAGAALNNAIAAAVVDANIGGAITYNVRVGATYTAAKSAAALANAVTLNAGTAGSTTNAGWCAIVYTADLLGNTQATNPGGTCAAPTASASYALPVAGVASVPFGVDRAQPTIGYSAGLAANAQITTAAIGGEFSVTVSDTGLVGNSGMQPAAPVTMYISQRVAAGNGPGTTTCLNANGTANATCVLSATGVNAAGNPIYTTAITAVTTDAYMTFNATAFDAAGNSASVASRTIVHDDGALTAGLVATPVTVSTIGWTGAAFLNDALDLASYWFSANYTTLIGVGAFVAAPSVAPDRFAQASTAVNGFNAASFLNTNYAISNTVNLPLAMQTGGVLYPMSGVNTNATNVAGLVVSGASAAAPAVAPALAVFAPTGLATFPALTNSIASNNISSGVTTAPTAGNPASGTLSVVATGPTATFNNPFSRVDFYAVNNGGAAGTEWRLIGSAAGPATLVDVGATRTFTWTAAISGATLYTQLGYTATAVTNVIAIGYNAAGTIGMINAAPYALNIIK